MPIRWRLTTWFSALLFTILAISGISFYALFQRYLAGSIDNGLRVYSARVHNALDTQEIPTPLDYRMVHSRIPPVNEFAAPGVYLQIIDADGNLVVKSENLGGQELPLSTILVQRGFTEGDAFGTLVAGGARVRVMISPLYLKDQVLYLEVAQSLRTVDHFMTQLRLALAAALIIALVAATLLGMALVRRVLRPVEIITRTAKKIQESSDLTRRVGYSGASDELGQLAQTFDKMVDYLDRAFRSQKAFVADASHELRSPLTVIQGNTDLLKRNLSDADRQESLRAIEYEARRMSKTVSDLLLLAEIESGQDNKLEAVSLDGLVQEESARARRLAPHKSITVHSPAPISLKGDAYRLHQVVGNLLANAVRYTADSGNIRVSLARDGDYARLDVADDGIGIPPEHLPNIFDRFYRVDKARARANGSTGLGLAIVRGIVEQHGGRVAVQSETGKGSIFTVWFKLG